MTIQNILLKKCVAPILLAFTFVATSAIADELKDISKMAEQGQQEAALDRVNAYLEANPKDAQGMFTKGIILAESGKRSEAIAAFNALTKAYPNLPEPYNNLAVLHAEAGEYNLAKKALETAIKTHPSYATAHENLGDIYARMASEAYDKALQLDSGNSRAQSKLSLIKDLFGAKTAVAANTTPTRPIRPASKKAVEPVTAPAPAPTAAPEQHSADIEGEITTAVQAWSRAWANQDVEAYLASYADTFTPARGKSRAAWEKTRRVRVSAPTGITHSMKNKTIEIMDDSNAKMSFRQYYKAVGRKAIHTNKTLILKKVNDSWLIDKEIASN